MNRQELSQKQMQQRGVTKCEPKSMRQNIKINKSNIEDDIRRKFENINHSLDNKHKYIFKKIHIIWL